MQGGSALSDETGAGYSSRHNGKFFSFEREVLPLKKGKT
jgi:hypothetical protein